MHKNHIFVYVINLSFSLFVRTEWNTTKFIPRYFLTRWSANTQVSYVGLYFLCARLFYLFIHYFIILLFSGNLGKRLKEQDKLKKEENEKIKEIEETIQSFSSNREQLIEEKMKQINSLKGKLRKIDDDLKSLDVSINHTGT